MGGEVVSSSESVIITRANTSINLSGAVADGSDIFRSCSNILDKFGGKPSRDNMAVVNGTARIGRSPATNSSFKVNINDMCGATDEEDAVDDNDDSVKELPSGSMMMIMIMTIMTIMIMTILSKDFLLGQ